MKSRRRIRRRFGSKPIQRQRTAWSTGVFETVVDIVGTPPDLLELTLFDPLVDMLPSTIDYTRDWLIKRIILNGAYTGFPLQVAPQLAAGVIHQAMYVIDREDTDAQIVTDTALGSILEGGTARLLFTDVRTALMTEQVAPTGNSPLVLLNDFWRTQIDFKAPVKIRGSDEILVFGMQCSTAGALGNVMNTLSFAGISRVLVVT